MLHLFLNGKVLCAVGGAVGLLFLQSKAARKLAVNITAKGMQLADNAKTTLRNIKDEAADICEDARAKAGLNKDETEVNEE